MTLVVLNLIGAPSVGKSTTAAKLFGELKALNLNVEYSPEVVKSWVYEGKKVSKYDQYYLFGCECHNQSRLFNSVDFIISDSSPILAAFYNYYYNKGDNSLAPACKEFYRKIAEDNIKVISFFLPRKKKYVAKGRYQTQSEAEEVALQLKDWLDREGYDYYYVDCPDKDRLNVILDILREVTGDFNGMALV
jgi:nicotinamide riboside kinase